MARPVAPYVGGKRNLARRIADRIAATPHDLYGEAFVGMGGVFLARRVPARVEVINDLSSDVATLFRVLQRHYQAFVDMLRWQLSSRAEFDRLHRQDPSTLTDLERSARFLYLQRLSWGGKVAGRTFGLSSRAPARFNLLKLEPALAALHERLAGVTIEQLDFEAFLGRYDRADALFYLDPPYAGAEHYYGRQLFQPVDLERLSAALRRVQGRWILSLNDAPRVRELFGWAVLEPVDTTWSIGQGQRVGELLITAR